MKSLRKAIDILELLKDSSRSHTIAELHEETSLPPSTIHWILNALAEKHFVTHDEATHTYQLGPALISLGVSAAKSFTLQDVARPILRELSAKIYEDSYLVVKVKDRGMVLLQQSGSNPLKVVEEFGYEMDLHCGAIRKVLLAYQDPSYIEYYMDKRLDRPNAFPRTSRRALEKDLHQIRQDGIAVSNGEYVHEAAGIGAPVFDHTGRIAASMGIILPLSRMHDEKRLALLKERIKESARALSLSLGYSE